LPYLSQIKMVFQKYIRSVAFALAGISFAFRNQFNMRFHIFVSSLVIILAIFFHIDPVEWCILLLCLGSVIASELINTSIELNINLYSAEYNEKASQVKVIAGASVLVTCTVSGILGLIIFIPRIF
jgi:undecaprenol kinase